MREGRYREKDKKACRLCGGGIESWEYMWEECRTWKGRGGGRQKEYGRILSEREEES